MAEAADVFPGVLDPERFFGRVGELRVLRREARLLARGHGRSRVVCARPGAGKTELLRQWHARLFLEGEIFPFWCSVPRDPGDSEFFCRDFLASLALQALAFRRRDPSLLVRSLTAGEIAGGLRSAWGDAGALLAEAVLGLEVRSQGPALAWAALVPHRLAARTGTRVLCFIDDADHLATWREGQAWPEEATASPIAPALLAIEDEELVPQLFGRAAAARLTFDRLAPLSPESASRLARHLARVAGLELGEEAVAALAGESAGSPFYLGALVRALGEGQGTGAVDVHRAAAAAACEGELARYWLDRLAGAIPDRRSRAVALEVLIFCLAEGEESPDAGRLAGLMLKPEADVESALAGLSRAGVVRLACARVVVDDDPVLRDVAQALYRREFGRVAPAAVVAALAAAKASAAPAVLRRCRREGFRAALSGILGTWAGQQVPAVLFDAAAFRDRHAGRAPEEVLSALAADPDVVALPRVVSVAAGRVGSGATLPALEVDALAWALRAAAGTPEADVAWVARCLPGGAGGAEQLDQFDRDVVALQSAGGLPPTRVVRWAILETPLDDGGVRAAARLRLSTSTRPQLEALARLLGAAVVLPPPVPVLSAAPTFEMEMVIPRAADVELVAAGALEQLAENLSLDAPVIGRLKVAVIEACINAFEHSGSRDGRVRLVFAVEAGRLLMRVENRGRQLAALPPRADAGRAARGRGWGLTLIRELVDDVVLEPREDGVSLLMVQHLGGGDRG